MYFASGPPRAYALPAPPIPTDGERVEDVALALDPLQRVVARVTSSGISLWTSSPRARRFHAPRLLATVARGGRFVEAAQRARHEASPFLGGVADGGCADTPQIFAEWVTNDRLAVVERGSQYVEFYAFDGLPSDADPLSDPQARDERSGGTPGVTPLSPASSAKIQGRFVDEYPVNQGESPRDRADVAWSMSAVTGGKYLFVGMESGLVCVVQLAVERRAYRDDGSVVGLWKIDVIAHLVSSAPSPAEDAAPLSPPSCYAITAATSDPVTQISKLALVACFDGGKCFIMLVSPASRTIEQLLSLVNTERGPSPSSCLGTCTTATLDASGARLALGWSDGGVSLFRLVLRRPPPASTDKASDTASSSTQQFHLEPLRELSMTPWGYSVHDVGGVTALAWTHDARALAVGYELRGFAVFSMDGCRLMASLPQHNQDRVAATTTTGDDDVTHAKEACPFGTLRLAWTRESTSLLAVARGVAFDVEMPAERVLEEEEEATTSEEASATTPPLLPPSVVRVDDLVTRVDVELLKEKDGLCLSLSGAPGRCGAWVRSDHSFTRRRDGGGMGPAEASQQIEGGDLLVAINGMEEVVNLPFEQIIQLIKGLPDDSTVTLGFLRLQWETVFPLASRALTSRAFLSQHGIHALLDADEEDLCVREYALRMQHEFGDCDQHERPSMLVFEARAKFDGWDALQGTTQRIAEHKYIKLLFALFPVWNPLHLLSVLVDFWTQHHDHAVLHDDNDDDAVQLAQLRRLSLASPRSRQRSLSSDFETFPTISIPTTLTRRRRVSRVAFAEFDFARTPLLANTHSKLFLLEDASIRKLSSPSLDDPCALMSAQSWRVPQAYDASCCPLRLVAASTSGQQIAVAGQRGFCLLNMATGKWRLFGNVHEEQDMRVQALHWLGDDVVLVAFSRFREHHAVLHVVAFPRNHLDEQSILAALAFPHDDAPSSSSSSSEMGSGAMIAMETDDADDDVYCLLRRELWCLGVEITGSIAALGVDLAVTLTLKRQVKLPSSILDAASSMSSTLARGPGLLDFSVLPRALNVQTRDHGTRSKSLDENDSDGGGGGGWLSSLVHMIAGGEVPDQYQPEEVLPRFAFLNADGDVVVWDPEQRSQRLLLSNVTTMARLFLPNDACDAWPTPCRLMYGLYGPEGMRLWLPLLDGVYLTHTKAFDQDAERLRTFLACHDPLRAKTYEIEFGTAPATAELYEHVVNEYGIALEAFVAAPSMRQPLDDGPRNLRGCIMTVDDPASRDLMLRFDSDVTLVGMQHAFGLLVGVSQDVYMPPGALPSVPCYDVFSRVQPFFHGVLTLLVRNAQLTWAAQIMAALRRNHFALASTTQELFLHAMLEACYSKQISLATFATATKLLQPSPANASSDHSGDMDEYCEIVAHVGRKSEPSRLKVLFPMAGDPMELLRVCRQRGELRTAANFLLILGECSTVQDEAEGDNHDHAAAQATTNLAVRSACAAELVAQCIEQDEWALAIQVVRVAREWVDDDHHGACFIDEQLGKIGWQDLVSGRFDRVVKCVNDLHAELPQVNGMDLGIAEAERESIAQRVHDTFVPSGKLQDLSVLLEAVTKAKYAQWTLLLQQVLAAATAPVSE